jgi:hypothetical protein
VRASIRSLEGAGLETETVAPLSATPLPRENALEEARLMTRDAAI